MKGAENLQHTAAFLGGVMIGAAILWALQRRLSAEALPRRRSEGMAEQAVGRMQALLGEIRGLMRGKARPEGADASSSASPEAGPA